jgi:hypothetical protein
MTKNDGLAKQVTTCIDMARALVSLVDFKLVAFESSDPEMIGLLFNAARVIPPFIAAKVNGQEPFEVNLNKVGIGDLKGQPIRFVHSEASLITHKESNRRFVVCWQNQPQEPIVGERIASVVLGVVHATGF